MNVCWTKKGQFWSLVFDYWCGECNQKDSFRVRLQSVEICLALDVIVTSILLSDCWVSNAIWSKWIWHFFLHNILSFTFLVYRVSYKQCNLEKTSTWFGNLEFLAFHSMVTLFPNRELHYGNHTVVEDRTVSLLDSTTTVFWYSWLSPLVSQISAIFVSALYGVFFKSFL